MKIAFVYKENKVDTHQKGYGKFIPAKKAV